MATLYMLEQQKSEQDVASSKRVLEILSGNPDWLENWQDRLATKLLYGDGSTSIEAFK